jgi:hypothetical protein
MSISMRPDYPPVYNRVRRQAVTEFIEAMRVELNARNAFKDEATPENLTAWATARNTLEERKAAL